MSAVDVHVIPLPQGWEVRRTGGRLAVSKHRTRSSAVRAGRLLATEIETDLIVYEVDGRTVALVEHYGRTSVEQQSAAG